MNILPPNPNAEIARIFSNPNLRAAARAVTAPIPEVKSFTVPIESAEYKGDGDKDEQTEAAKPPFIGL